MIVLNMLKESWKRIERVENCSSVLLTFMNYIASKFGARYVAFCEKRRYSERWKLDQTWRTDQCIEDVTSDRDINPFEEAFKMVFPQTTLVIKNEESAGYH